MPGEEEKNKIYIVKPSEDPPGTSGLSNFDFTGNFLNWKIKKKINEPAEFKGDAVNLTSDTNYKDYLSAGNFMYVMSGTKLISKFIIEEPVYKSDYTIEVSGYESTGISPEIQLLSSNTEKQEYENAKIDNILFDFGTVSVLDYYVPSICVDSEKNLILRKGDVSEDSISISVDNEKRIDALNKVCDNGRKEWNIRHPFNNTDVLDVVWRIGSPIVTKEFYLTGDSRNCSESAGAGGTSSVTNDTTVQGRDINGNQIETRVFEATDTQTRTKYPSDTWLKNTIGPRETRIKVASLDPFDYLISSNPDGSNLSSNVFIKIDNEIIEIEDVDIDNKELIVKQLIDEPNPVGRGSKTVSMDDNTTPSSHRIGSDVVFVDDGLHSEYDGITEETPAMRIYVDDTSAFPASGYIRVGSEVMTYTDKDDTASYFVCIRMNSDLSWANTYAHSDGIKVYNGYYTVDDPGGGSIKTNGQRAETITDNNGLTKNDLDKKAEQNTDSKKNRKTVTIEAIEPYETWNQVNLGDEVRLNNTGILNLSEGSYRLVEFEYEFPPKLTLHLNNPQARGFTDGSTNFADDIDKKFQSRRQEATKSTNEQREFSGEFGDSDSASMGNKQFKDIQVPKSEWGNKDPKNWIENDKDSSAASIGWVKSKLGGSGEGLWTEGEAHLEPHQQRSLLPNTVGVGNSLGNEWNPWHYVYGHRGRFKTSSDITTEDALDAGWSEAESIPTDSAGDNWNLRVGGSRVSIWNGPLTFNKDNPAGGEDDTDGLIRFYYGTDSYSGLTVTSTGEFKYKDAHSGGWKKIGGLFELSGSNLSPQGDYNIVPNSISTNTIGTALMPWAGIFSGYGSFSGPENNNGATVTIENTSTGDALRAGYSSAEGIPEGGWNLRVGGDLVQVFNGALAFNENNPNARLEFPNGAGNSAAFSLNISLGTLQYRDSTTNWKWAPLSGVDSWVSDYILDGSKEVMRLTQDLTQIVYVNTVWTPNGYMTGSVGSRVHFWHIGSENTATEMINYDNNKIRMKRIGFFNNSSNVIGEYYDSEFENYDLEILGDKGLQLSSSGSRGTDTGGIICSCESLRPYNNKSSNLGSPGTVWNNLYTKNINVKDGAIDLNSNNINNAGIVYFNHKDRDTDTDNYIGEFFEPEAKKWDLKIVSDNGLQLSSTGQIGGTTGGIICSCETLRPHTSGATLGNSSMDWKDVYLGKSEFNSEGEVTVAHGLRVRADNSDTWMLYGGKQNLFVENRSGTSPVQFQEDIIISEEIALYFSQGSGEMIDPSGIVDSKNAIGHQIYRQGDNLMFKDKNTNNGKAVTLKELNKTFDMNIGKDRFTIRDDGGTDFRVGHQLGQNGINIQPTTLKSSEDYPLFNVKDYGETGEQGSTALVVDRTSLSTNKIIDAYQGINIRGGSSCNLQGNTLVFNENIKIYPTSGDLMFTDTNYTKSLSQLVGAEGNFVTWKGGGDTIQFVYDSNNMITDESQERGVSDGQDLWVVGNNGLQLRAENNSQDSGAIICSCDTLRPWASSGDSNQQPNLGAPNNPWSKAYIQTAYVTDAVDFSFIYDVQVWENSGKLKFKDADNSTKTLSDLAAEGNPDAIEWQDKLGTGEDTIQFPHQNGTYITDSKSESGTYSGQNLSLVGEEGIYLNSNNSSKYTGAVMCNCETLRVWNPSDDWATDVDLGSPVGRWGRIRSKYLDQSTGYEDDDNAKLQVYTHVSMNQWDLFDVDWLGVDKIGAATDDVVFYDDIDMNDNDIDSVGDLDMHGDIDLNEHDLDAVDDIFAGGDYSDIGSPSSPFDDLYIRDVNHESVVYAEKHCALCDEQFKEGEILSDYVLSNTDEGTRTIPVHTACGLKTEYQTKEKHEEVIKKLQDQEVCKVPGREDAKTLEKMKRKQEKKRLKQERKKKKEVKNNVEQN